MPNTAPPNKYKLIGKDYPTGDLYAKVTGKAKYAEDFRADGMLFCKLLLSPMPHARVRNIDTCAALAMPGVKAILTADELPPPANSINDNGNVILANPRGYQALTMEPLFQGQPILAVAAVDELTAAAAARPAAACDAPGTPDNQVDPRGLRGCQGWPSAAGQAERRMDGR